MRNRPTPAPTTFEPFGIASLFVARVPVGWVLLAVWSSGLTTGFGVPS